MHELAAVVKGAGVERIDRQGGVPAEPQLGAVRLRRADVLAHPGSQVPAPQVPLLAHRVALQGIDRIGPCVESVPETDLLPVMIADAAVFPHGVRPAPGAVVLHAAVNVVGDIQVHGDVVVLGQRQVVHESPGLAAVVTECHAAVVPVNHVIRIVRIDPQGVVVGMDLPERHEDLERLAAVVGNADQGPEIVDAVGPLRVHLDVGVVERALDGGRLRVYRHPRLAAVRRPDQSAALRLHQGVDDARIGPGDRHADPSEIAGRQAVLLRESLPVPAAVDRDEQSRSRPAGSEEPRPSTKIVHCREQFQGVRGVHDQISGAGFFVDIQDLLPRFAAVLRPVDAALRVLAPFPAHCRRVSDVRVGGVEDDPVDPLGRLEPHVGPGLAPVQRFVDAVSHRHAVAGIPFAGSHPDNVGARLEHCDRADSGHRLVVEDWRPVEAAVCRFPHPAGGGPQVDDVGVGLHRFDVGDPAAHSGRTDGAGLHSGEEFRIDFSIQDRSGR